MPNHLKIAIIVCASLAEEVKSVAAQYPIPFELQIIEAQCHRDPPRLRCTIDSYVSSLLERGFKIFIAYGGCSSYINPDSEHIFCIGSLNCAALLLGGDREYLNYADKAYFLTPYLARNWKEYFLGKSNDYIPDEKTVGRLKRWFSSIDKVVKIDIGSNFREDENKSAREFASLIEKPIVFLKGNLDLLKQEYSRLISSMV